MTAMEGAPDMLLVDDNPDEAELLMLAREFTRAEFTVKLLHDGVNALDFLLDDGQSGAGARSLPRLVLLDLNTPRLNGFQVLQRLRADARTRQLPVIIFSASNREADERMARALGANDYIRKPLDFQSLCNVVSQLDRDWLGPQPGSPASAA